MASFNVADFRSQMKGDGARPNLFECHIPKIGNILSNASTNFNFMCRAAQLPGSTVNQVPVNYFGRELKFAGNRTFTEWTVTVINDEDFRIRNSFEIWMSKINSHVENVRDSEYYSPSQYQADAFITQHSKLGAGKGPVQPAGLMGAPVAGIKQYKFFGLFPIDISPIEMDWGANDSIEEFAVTFAYQWWESNTTDHA